MNQQYFVNRDLITRPPIHPGEILAEDVMPALLSHNRKIGEIAALLGVSRQTLHRVMKCQIAVSPEMAVRLGKLCGNGPGIWLRMQARFDAYWAAKHLAREIRRIPTLS